MRTRPARSASLYVVSASLAFLGLGALYGGGSLLLAPDGHLIGLPLNGLHTPLFTDYLLPGLILFLLFGAGSLANLIALWTRPWPTFSLPLPLLRQEHWSWGAAFGLGAAQLIWIFAQLLLTSFRAPLQLLCGGAGFLIVLFTLVYLLRQVTRHEWART